RRCFNLCDLCDAFPRLFDLIDNSATGELDGVAPAEYQRVADACTLCDMCFTTKCPYVPPHEFNVDFPPSYAAVSGRRAARARGSLAAAPTGGERSQWASGGRSGAAGQLGERPREQVDPAADGEGGRGRSAGCA